jgi:hypothetical protein
MTAPRAPIRACAGIAALFLSAGCSNPFSNPCTNVGCTTQVTVQISGAANQTITDFKGTVAIGGKQFTVDCVSATDSSPGVGILCRGPTAILDADALAGSATVDITANSGTLAFTGSVPLEDRSTFQPNGPGCPPECTTAKARVAVTTH